jgi:hypothetical protein
LAKDISEQPDSRFILLLPDLNVSLAVDSLTVTDGVVGAWQNDEKIGMFPNHTVWTLVKRDRTDIITRKQQLERSVSHQKAEEGLVLELMPELAEEVGKHRKANGKDLPLPGQYV